MSNATPGPFPNLFRYLIAFGVFVLIAFLFGKLGGFIVSKIFQLDAAALIDKAAAEFTFHEQMALKVFQTISAASIVIAAFVITRVFRESFTHYTGLSTSPQILHFILGLGIFLAMIPLMSDLINWNANLKLPKNLAIDFIALEEKSDNLYRVFLDLNHGPYFVANIFMMALLPAVGEELIFRGIFLRIFVKWTKNIHIGVLISAAMFALLHFQPYKLVPMIYIAIILGYLYYFTGSLWVPIAVHFINNAVVVIAELLLQRGYDHAFLRADYLFPSWMVVVSTTVLILLFVVLRKTSKPMSFE